VLAKLGGILALLNLGFILNWLHRLRFENKLSYNLGIPSNQPKLPLDKLHSLKSLNDSDEEIEILDKKNHPHHQPSGSDHK
jgi:hypothetical protein